VKPYRFLAAALVEYDQATRWYVRRAPATAEKPMAAGGRAIGSAALAVLRGAGDVREYGVRDRVRRVR
jgi:hypothetical protein